MMYKSATPPGRSYPWSGLPPTLFTLVLVAAAIVLGIAAGMVGDRTILEGTNAAAPTAAAEEGAEAAEEEGGLGVSDLDFEKARITLEVENASAEETTLATVMVDEAIFPFTVEGDHTMQAGESRIVTIPYQWVEGDAYEFAVVDAKGALAEAEAVAGPNAAFESEGGEEE